MGVAGGRDQLYPFAVSILKKIHGCVGYLLNAFTVFIGVIGMSYYSLMKPEGLGTIPYILLLLVKLGIAHLILRKMRPQGPSPVERGCRE